MNEGGGVVGKHEHERGQASMQVGTNKGR
jgi:hypothetical protein